MQLVDYEDISTGGYDRIRGLIEHYGAALKYSGFGTEIYEGTDTTAGEENAGPVQLLVDWGNYTLTIKRGY